MNQSEASTSSSNAKAWESILDDWVYDDPNPPPDSFNSIEFDPEDPYKKLSPDLSKTNCCRIPNKEENVLKTLSNALTILETIDVKNETTCIISEILNSCSEIIGCIESSVEDKYLLNAADVFLRSRHEVLHNLSLLTMQLPLNKTDIKFSDVLPISSDRTPDSLFVKENHVVIVETTATTDVNKAYFSKGKMEFGFKPKYEREIEELKIGGFDVSYYTLIFNIRDLGSVDYKKDLESCASSVGSSLSEDNFRKLEMVRRTFCELQTNKFKMIQKYMTDLFGFELKPFGIPKETILNLTMESSDDDGFCYNKTGLSLNTYNKLITSWPRFLSQLTFVHEKNVSEEYQLRLDISKNRFLFVCGVGLSFDQWCKALAGNDRVMVISNLRLFVGSEPYQEYRTDVEHFTISSGKYKKKAESDFYIPNHQGSAPFRSNFNYHDYKVIEENNVFKGRKPIYLDKDYEEVLERCLFKLYDGVKTEEDLEHFMSDLKNKKPFSLNKVDHTKIKAAVSDFETAYVSENSFDQSLNAQVLHQKPAFIYPLFNPNGGSYMSYKSKNETFLTRLLSQNLGEYTKMIINRCLSKDFHFGGEYSRDQQEVLDLKEKQRELNAEIYRICTKHKRETHSHTKSRDIEECKPILDKLKPVNNEIRKLSTKVSSNMMRLPTKKRSYYRNHFDSEMKHFKDKKDRSVYKGVGRFDHVTLKTEYDNIYQEMINPSEIECVDQLIHEHVSNDVTLLEISKTDMLNNKMLKHKRLRNTNIYHSCNFVSRMCHTISYFSQTPVGSDYVMVDNLGYSNVLLMMKGGKKIFKTKRSKLFKIVFPIYPSSENWYSRSGYQSNFQLFKMDGLLYCCSPWQNMEETLLNDGLTFLSRSMGYALLDKEQDHLATLNKTFFNILLAFNGRRQTEVMMHSMRYITVNCMSDLSNIEKMLPTMSGFNYDFFQCFIRESLLINFEKMALKLMAYNNDHKGDPENALKQLNISHLMHNSFVYQNTEDLTLAIYSTFLMSKAPVTQSLEQLSNLKSILKTQVDHNAIRPTQPIEQYLKHTAKCDGDFKKYWETLFESDFMYDPHYVTLCGKFAADYLLSNISKEELENKWQSVMRQPWDEMANTSGLRGDRDTNFFNKKGYYIVYGKVLQDPENIKKLYNIFNSDDSDQKKRSNVDKLNVNYSEAAQMYKLDQVIFHVVDKKQRGGSREIYVMDYKTKIAQQPVEKFSKFLCKQFPNEMISVPSNKRLFNIHTNVFEKRPKSEGVSYNAVLDCRRWAPHSVINKFVDFALGMSDALPKTFLIHFIRLMELMYGKRVYTRKYIYEILKNNKHTDKRYLNELFEDSEVQGYYLNMPYSWMMGIFNYFSSLLHVANQMHASHIISRISNKAETEVTYYHMIAHSDDSAGKITTMDRFRMRKTFLIYECLLKSANHMLSDKKCTISRVYFEFISILYISNRLVSLLPKFTGAFNFHPTDKGYCSDINESYSKCIELLSSGADLSDSYISMKIMSKAIHRFYFTGEMSKLHYRLPPQLFGIPDAHPLMVLLTGSDSDLIRLYSTEEKSYIKMLFNINKRFVNPELSPEAFLSGVSCSPKVNKNKDLKLQASQLDFFKMDENLKWILKNVNLNNTMLNTVSYLLKLSDVNFVASLQDETLTRRISRAYYFRSSSCIKTKYGSFTISECRDMITWALIADKLTDVPDQNISSIFSDLIKEINLQEDIFENMISCFEIMHSEVIMFNKAMKNINYRQTDYYESKKSSKPIHISIMKSSLPIATDFRPEEMAAWVRNPEYRWLLSYGGYEVRSKQVLEHLEQIKNGVTENIDINLLSKLFQKLKSKYVKEMYIYSQMPSDIRDISTYKDLLSFISENTFHKKSIKGIVSPYNKRFNENMLGPLQNLITEEDRLFLSLIDFYTCVSVNPRLFNKLESFQLNQNVFNLGHYENLLELFNNYHDNLHTRPEYKMLMGPHIISLLRSDRSGNVHPSDHLKNSFYECYTKRQHLTGNIWLGKGNLLIGLGDIKIHLELNNMSISSLVANKNKYNLSRLQQTYLDNCINKAGFNNLTSYMTKPDPNDWNKTSFGVDENGNYVVNRNRVLNLSFKSFKCNNLSSVAVSDLSLCYVKLLPGMRYSARSEMNSEKAYICKTFEVSPTDIIKILQKLYNNDYNIRLLDSEYTEFNDFLDVLIGDVTDLEMKVDLNNVIDNFNISRLFKIMKKMRDVQYINFNNNKIREPIHPAQEGGMLSALVEYKKYDSNFRFNPDIIITPELMYLKSTQPESFMSEMATNLNLKYNSLYSESDKTQIIHSLHSLSKESGDESELTSRLIQLMTIWGYVGVMGSLENYANVKGEEKLKAFYIDPENLSISRLNSYLYRSMIEALLTAFEESDPDISQSEHFRMPTTVNEFKLFLISYTHSYFIRAMCSKFSLPQYCVSMCDISLGLILSKLMDSNGYRSILSKCLESQPMLANIDFMSISGVSLRSIISTMLCNVALNQRSDNELVMGDRGIRTAEGLILPYKRTKDLLEEIASFTAKNVYYYGAFEPGFIKYFSNKHTLIYDNQLFIFEPNMKPLSNQWVVFNSEFVFNRPLEEEFLESDDYYELSAEMEYPDFPPSILDDYPPVYVKPYDRRLWVSNNSRYKRANLIKPTFLNAVGFSRSNGVFQRLRQSGETIILICDCIFKEQVGIKSEFIKFFKPYTTSHFNQALISTDFYFYMVWDSKPIKVGLWEQYLDSTVINIADYLELGHKHKVTEFRDNTGMIVEDFYTDPDLEELLKRLSEVNRRATTAEVDEVGLEEEKEKILNEAELKIEEIKSLNPDLKFMERYSRMIKKAYNIKEDLNVAQLQDIVMSILSSESDRKRIFDSVNKSLKMVSDAGTIDKIWQVPGIFSMGGVSESQVRNRALKDSGIRAELESIGVSLANKILSGLLKISSRQRQLFSKHIKLCKGYLKGSTKKRENKTFMVDLFTLVVNDAMTANDDNDDNIFRGMQESLTNYIIDDEEDVNSDEDIYEGKEIDVGTLKYKPVLAQVQ